MAEPINITRRERGTEKTNLRRGGSRRDLSILSLRHGREETAESRERQTNLYCCRNRIHELVDDREENGRKEARVRETPDRVRRPMRCQPGHSTWSGDLWKEPPLPVL